MNKEKYRLVSVTVLACVSKPYEYIMFDQLMGYFGAIVAPNISAYRKVYSTHHVLMSSIEYFKQSLNNNECVGLVLMDLSKGLDALPHGMKLHAYGGTNSAYNFISNYLSLTSQVVLSRLGIKSDRLRLREVFHKDQCQDHFLFDIYFE